LTTKSYSAVSLSRSL